MKGKGVCVWGGGGGVERREIHIGMEGAGKGSVQHVHVNYVEREGEVSPLNTFSFMSYCPLPRSPTSSLWSPSLPRSSRAATRQVHSDMWHSDVANGSAGTCTCM